MKERQEIDIGMRVGDSIGLGNRSILECVSQLHTLVSVRHAKRLLPLTFGRRQVRLKT